MAWSFSTDRPVYIQVADRIRRMVISGEFSAGQQIPSVRQLATDAAVNPNTIQHAFVELESEGLLISKGTLGRFVTEDPSIINECRVREAKDLVRSFIQRAEQLSINQDTLINMIKEEFDINGAGN